MKRSNRLVLLLGIFLAVAAFFLIVLSFNKGGGTTGVVPPAPTTVKIVIAATDIPLGSRITQEMVTTKDFGINDKPADGFNDVALVIGQTARTFVAAQQLITSVVLNGSSGSMANVDVPAGFVAIAISLQQDQAVGSLVKAGDHVDLVVAYAVPVSEFDPNATTPDQFVPVGDAYVKTSVKSLIQGVQVLGTLAAPAPATTGGAAGGVTLTGQPLMVILAVTAQQAELIDLSQKLDPAGITLVLRSAKDCQNADGSPAACATVKTTGATLRILVDSYGVVPPQIVEVIQPKQLVNSKPAVGGPNR